MSLDIILNVHPFCYRKCKQLSSVSIQCQLNKTVSLWKTLLRGQVHTSSFGCVKDNNWYFVIRFNTSITEDDRSMTSSQLWMKPKKITFLKTNIKIYEFSLTWQKHNVWISTMPETCSMAELVELKCLLNQLKKVWVKHCASGMLLSNQVQHSRSITYQLGLTDSLLPFHCTVKTGINMTSLSE